MPAACMPRREISRDARGQRRRAQRIAIHRHAIERRQIAIGADVRPQARGHALLPAGNPRGGNGARSSRISFSASAGVEHDLSRAEHRVRRREAHGEFRQTKPSRCVLDRSFVISPGSQHLLTAASPSTSSHRPLRDLRISVTDRCNFRCPYCMPKEVFGAGYPFLRDPQLMTLRRTHADRAGVPRRSAWRKSASRAANRCCAPTCRNSSAR